MRYALIAVLVFATLAGVSSYGYVQAYSALQAAKDSNKELTLALRAEQARTARIQQTVQELESRNAKSRSTLNRALADAPAWSAGDVPMPVADSLCNSPGARCAARKVPAP